MITRPLFGPLDQAHQVQSFPVMSADPARSTRRRHGRVMRPVTREQRPAPVGVAVASVTRCVAVAGGMLLRGRLRMPRTWVGTRFRFADGTSAPVYRETVAVRAPATDPCVLVVGFRLRWVRGRGHDVFRWTSIVNTPLFVGFPGFVAKWWLTADDLDRYRGIYQWDGAEQAERYARALWRVLALVSVRGSIRYHVLPGSWRDDVARRTPSPIGPADDTSWWRVDDADLDPLHGGG